MEAVYNHNTGYVANRDLFNPPVCNKLQHKKQLTIMFVGGPNVRTDFHLEQGSEFFWMVRGNMELPTIQNGQRKVVKIQEGQVFCLPSRIPHSPQRPETGSLGLVVERERYVDPEKLNGRAPELDGLRWFVDFDKTTGTDILWEKFFHCYDLGRDLVPVVQEYHASEEKTSRTPGPNVLTAAARPLVVNTTTVVPDPFDLMAWVDDHAAEMATVPQGLNLFHHGVDHPDQEFHIYISGGLAKDTAVEYDAWAKGDTWLYQLKGSSAVAMRGNDRTNSQQLLKNVSGVVPPNEAFTLIHEEGSVVMMVRNDWEGNK
jgi:3-hydroxyanthranilate 3,4-dioxygenase